MSAANIARVATYLDKIVPLEQQELTGVLRAGTPSGSQTRYDQVIMAFGAVVAEEIAARQAADAHALRPFRTAFARDANAGAHFTTLARSFGVDTCAQS